jgi:hypothetical protein
MTSIQWLIEQLQAPCRGIPSDIIEQAKEMHKKEIEDAFENSRLAYVFKKDMPPVFENFEQYYKETFKKD